VPGRSLSPTEIKKLLADERAKILAELDRLETIDLQERQEEGRRRFTRRLKMGETLSRGREFDLSMVEMAQALGTTRQMAYVILGEYEEGQRAKAKRSRVRKEAKGA
jgi:hypothetical protein